MGSESRGEEEKHSVHHGKVLQQPELIVAYLREGSGSRDPALTICFIKKVQA